MPVAQSRTQSAAPRHHLWLTRILAINAALQVLIVVTGGLVRLTGSGLGCPTWPQCVPGSYVPVPHQEQGFHKVIEFGNRTLTSVLTIAAVAAVVAVWKWAPRRRQKTLALTVLVGVAVQAVLGGITVLVGLHPLSVAAHFLISAALVAVATRLFLIRYDDAAGALVVPPLVHRLAWVTCAVAAVVLALGTVVTGSGPHSGDAERPARFGFDPRTISWLHADAVMLFCGLVIAMWLAVALTSAGRAARAWRDVFIVTLLQGAIGYTQYLTDLPWVLVLVHMLGAVLLVVSLTRAVTALRHTPSPD